MAQFLSAMQRYEPGVPLHTWVTDGWIAAQEFADAVRSMGANVTRAGLERWFKGQTGNYDANGLMIPLTYQVRDFSKPQSDCYTMSQWQDSKPGFVIKAPMFTCDTVKYYPYQPVNTGGS